MIDDPINRRETTTEEDVWSAVAELREKIDALTAAVALLIEQNPGHQPTAWAYDARFPMPVPNMYDAEYGDKYVKRWVGPLPHFEVSPNLEGGRNYMINMLIPDFVNINVAKSFGVTVNGIPLRVQRIDGKSFRAEFHAPRRGQQHIKLSCAESLSPAQLEQSSDKRKLAFSIASILIIDVNLNANK